MKRILLAAAFFGTTLFTDAFAQFTGGSAGREATPAAPAKPAPTDKGVFDNAFYFKFGRSTPKGTFGDVPTMARSAEDSYNGLDGLGATNGINFEMGLLAYLRSIPLAEKFKIGIDAGISVSANQVDWTPMNPNYQTTDQVPFIFSGFKIGPAFSYNIVDRLIVDVYAKINPCFSTPADISFYEDNADESYSYSLTNAAVSPTFATRKSLGMNLRYSALLLSMEYNFGKVNYSLDESFYTYSSGTLTNSGFRNFEAETPTNSLLLSVGLKF